jgi:hypothetical protein
MGVNGPLSLSHLASVGLQPTIFYKLQDPMVEGANPVHRFTVYHL